MSALVYVECDNPRVLAEHDRVERRHPQHEPRWSADWRWSEAEFAGQIAKGGWKHHLVWPDAAAAGQGLVDYRDRLGAVLHWAEEGRDPNHWPMHQGWDADAIAGEFAKGVGVRIVGSAPATPEPEGCGCLSTSECRPGQAGCRLPATPQRCRNGDPHGPHRWPDGGAYWCEGSAAPATPEAPERPADERVAAVLSVIDGLTTAGLDEPTMNEAIARDVVAALGLSGGAALIAAERRRQVEVEGWTAEHDDQHREGDLRDAARCYLLAAAKPDEYPVGQPPGIWPWDAQWWKPTDPLRNLVKAGALVAAEVDRMQSDGARPSITEEPPCPECGTTSPNCPRGEGEVCPYDLPPPAGEPRQTPDDEPPCCDVRDALRDLLDGRTAAGVPGSAFEVVDRSRLDADALAVVDRRGFHRHTRESLAAEMADPSGILAPARPPLPEGVEPVSWSPRYGCWVLWSDEVPSGWKWAYLKGDAADGFWVHGGCYITGPAPVLARPVPEPPEPAEEQDEPEDPRQRVVVDVADYMATHERWSAMAPREAVEETVRLILTDPDVWDDVAEARTVPEPPESPEPETERVPWWEALSEARKIDARGSWEPVRSAGHALSGALHVWTGRDCSGFGLMTGEDQGVDVLREVAP